MAIALGVGAWLLILGHHGWEAPDPESPPMKYPKRSQYKYAKSRYRVRNWAEYEAGLQKRGDLTVWLSDDALDSWRAAPSGKPGGQRTYADIAIEAALTIRMVFHLPLRQTEGFLRSLADLLELDLPIPDHTTLSRRLQKLSEIRFRKLTTARPIHLLIDSTGLRIHVGHLREPPKRRAWRKLHLAVDADTGEIVASDLTGRRTGDSARVPALLGQIEHRVASVDANGRSARATASAAWWRTPCTVTRRSSVEGCEVEPSLDNELRYSWRARSSTR